MDRQTLVILLLLMLCISRQAIAQDTTLHKFAKYLENKGAYPQAILEYQHWRLSYPLAKAKHYIPEIKLNIYTDLNKNATQLFDSIILLNRDLENKIEIVNRLSYYNLLLEDTITSRKWLTYIQITCRDSVIAIPKFCLSATLGDWKNAKLYLPTISSVMKPAMYKSNDSIINLGLRIKEKDPFLAGTLSAMVPGLGKVYTGEFGLAAFNLTSFIACAVPAKIAFEQRGTSSVAGYIFGGAAVAFYVGNVYGAVKSAKNYKARKEEKLMEKARINGLQIL
ncbi:MAG: hypothetical protein SGJ04_08220 [Bacteroidota bacterium]|nr:hypothetical protein [Bacteroidota bacterium]